MKSRIYIYRRTRDYVDQGGTAFASDGEELARHFSSNHSFFQHDMGLKGTAGMGGPKHDKYAVKYPAGYELVEVIGPGALKNHVDAGDILNIADFIADEMQ